MEIVHPRVAGLDVHKKQVTVAVLLPGASPGERTVQVRQFRTFWRALQQMAAWLVELGVTDAAMESTGVYWWPVCHALAQTGSIEVCVCNAAHMRNVPGRKTDVRDAQWIAELHQHGLLRPSFIPTQATAALRARTRYRKKLIEARTSEGQRLAKVLEDAGVKIDSVASTPLGVSGRQMIEALIGGERDPFVLASLAKGVLRRKHDELAGRTARSPRHSPRRAWPAGPATGSPATSAPARPPRPGLPPAADTAGPVPAGTPSLAASHAPSPPERPAPQRSCDAHGLPSGPAAQRRSRRRHTHAAAEP